MPNGEKMVGCSKCEENKKGHNFCRMCGEHLTAGYAQNTRIAVTYFTNEKFCGYCGASREVCEY